MSRPTPSYSLYYVTGRPLLPSPYSSNPGHLEHLERALQGGVTVVQVREKDVDTREFWEVARGSKEVCDKYSVPLIINDRLDIALSLSCGLHIGQSDLPALEARRLLGPNQLLGVSINTLAELDEVLAYPEGTVDYIGIGPCYGTLTKKDLNPLMGTRGVRSILKRLGESKIRAVVIGGITPLTIPNVLRQTSAPLPSGAYRSLDGLAIVSSIAASNTPEQAVQELKKLWEARPSYPLAAQGKEAQELSAEQVVAESARLLDLLRGERRPLIHHITNSVVMNDCANLTLALGASPIMSASADEAPSLSLLIGALLLNLGTLSRDQTHAQTVAGVAANQGGKPVVFDPVGVGATSYRREAAEGLLSAVHMSIIKGNPGEIGTLYGSTEVSSRGVDSVGAGFKDPATIVRELARREKLIVAMSGPIDYISDGTLTFAIENGHEYQAVITGSGCMASTAVAAFAALAEEGEGATKGRGALVAAVAGLTAINVAAELAAQRSDVKGPNTFRAALIDECYQLKSEDVKKLARVKLV